MNESLVQWVLLRRPEYLQERLGFKLERKLGENYTTDQGRIDFAFETKEPTTYEQTPEIYRWKEWLSKTHDKFEKDKAGKVFIVFSIKREGKKVIYNPEVVDEIKKETSMTPKGDTHEHENKKVFSYQIKRLRKE